MPNRDIGLACPKPKDAAHKPAASEARVEPQCPVETSPIISPDIFVELGDNNPQIARLRVAFGGGSLI